MKKGSVLVVDDNRNVLTALRIFLGSHFEEVTLLATPNALASTLREKRPDVVLLDMNFSAGINSGNEGLYWLREIKKFDGELPVVLFTAYADVELAVAGLKEGAFDFLVKPWDNAKLLATLQAALELRTSRREVKRLKDRQSVLNQELCPGDDVCWGTSKAMQELLSLVEKVARTDANILITGENGTGKELIARKIHCISDRASEAMVSVDPGSLTESLFESELFGHVKGAFTDAKADRAGKFEAADGGTLFLDEIGNLSYPLQAKLLVALQSRKITRVGSNVPIRVDIRLISATNKDLPLMVAENAFREDLFYRINTIQIEVPPLRERRGDLPLLARFFLEKFAKKYGKAGLTLGKSAIEKLESYGWPGNVRELQHAVEKAVILGEGPELSAADFFFNVPGEKFDATASVSLDELERLAIKNALAQHGKNLSATAAQLGISRPTLYSKMKKYDLE